MRRVDVPAVQLWNGDVMIRSAVLMIDSTDSGVWFTGEDGTSWYRRGSVDLDEFAAELEAEAAEDPELYVDEPGIVEFYRELAKLAREMGR